MKSLARDAQHGLSFLTLPPAHGIKVEFGTPPPLLYGFLDTYNA
jgi:hypothetical protein